MKRTPPRRKTPMRTVAPMTATCERCGRAYRTKATEVARGRRFCSMACRDAGKMVERRCPQCDTAFTVPLSHDARRVFCSRPCADAGKRARSHVKRTCRHCKIEFMAKRSQLNAYGPDGAGVYCSSACRKAARPRKRNGARSADLAWRKAVKERDGHRCRRCGATEALHAHHVQPRGPSPHLRHDIDNGVTLCRLCHSHVHAHPAESYEVGWLKRSDR